MALCLTGDKLTAQDAKAMGMIWDVQDDALAAAKAMAERLAAMPTRALVATRHLLRGAHTHSLDEQLDIERDVQSRLGFTHDYIEGVTAFAKTPGAVQGRMSMSDTHAARALAERVGAAMFAADRASRETMGMELLACEPGRAVMRMAVQPLHLNGHQICHGGFIFTLADSTFAFACNSRNHNTVAAGCSIEF
jgi:hypothetical protein